MQSAVREVRLHGLEKLWVQAYQVNHLRLNFRLTHAIDNLTAEGLIIRDSGEFIQEEAHFASYDDKGVLLEQVSISKTGRFSLELPWRECYRFMVLIDQEGVLEETIIDTIKVT